MSTQSEWLTATEAASYLRIKPRTILLWARQGHIGGHILSGTRRVTCASCVPIWMLHSHRRLLHSRNGGFSETTEQKWQCGTR